MGMYELIKEFRSQTEGQDLPPSARLLYYELIFEFEESCWKTELAYSERELSILTGFSKTAINNAITKLKEFGYIKAIQSHGRRTKFKITSDHFKNLERTVFDQSQSKKLPNPLLSIPKIQLEEKKVRILGKEKNNNITNNKSAGAREGASQISDELNRCWIENVGENPRGGVYIKLLEAEQKYGTEKVVDAVNTAAIYNKEPRLSFAYVLKIIENTQTKGAVQSGRNPQTSTDGDYKWEDPPDLDKY